ncbi:PQQ-dependent sugar dehydrogenase [uncultured Jatrophihabitans sp.]|uniref:PQQ-dependent sugar dehydrogenase n=1 Tax=uncultured Jatrophihabitans sp. TaxID=1610747 RepID=UPI0035CA7070
MRRASCLAVAAVAVLVTACSSGSPDTDFSPSPGGTDVEGQGGVHIDPIIPTPSLKSGSTGSGPPAGSSGSSSGTAGPDSLVVASKLTTPVGIALLPDGTALVGERTTGRIVRVQPKAGKPVPTVRTLTGLSTAGGGGLMDLAVSPDYVEDNLIYAYISTATDNRVVDFTLKGPVTPILTGIPRGSSDNAGRLTFGADGDLYIATGDAGRPTLAANATSLAGKVLRITDIGEPVRRNPTARSPVLARGFRSSAGLCASTASPNVFQVEQRGSAAPVVNVVTSGGNYGWPTASAATKKPVSTLPAADSGPGGCAVQSGRLWVTSLDGKTLISGGLVDSPSPQVGQYSTVLTDVYGRLLNVVPAPDGALWITTSNRDGKGTPVAADERVIRYPPASVGGAGGRTT